MTKVNGHRLEREESCVWLLTEHYNAVLAN